MAREGMCTRGLVGMHALIRGSGTHDSKKEKMTVFIGEIII